MDRAGAGRDARRSADAGTGRADKGKVGGPFTWRLTEAPTDRLLHGLRVKVAATSDETSLDRLFFPPAADPDATPELVLQGATIAVRLRRGPGAARRLAEGGRVSSRRSAALRWSS